MKYTYAQIVLIPDPTGSFPNPPIANMQFARLGMRLDSSRFVVQHLTGKGAWNGKATEYTPEQLNGFGNDRPDIQNKCVLFATETQPPFLRELWMKKEEPTPETE